jgi:hypothetical protein
MQDKLKKLTIPGVLILFLAIVLTILLIRIQRNDSLLISNTSFETLNNINNSYGQNQYINFLNNLLQNFGELSIIILQVLLAISSFWLFFLILKSEGAKTSIIFNVLLFILISPAFLYNTLIINTQILILFLFLLTGYLFLKKKPLSYLIGVLLFLTDVFSLLILIAIILFYKKKYMWSLIVSILPLILILKDFTHIYNIIFEFGIISGYSLGLIIFTIIGIGMSRDNIKENNGIYLLFLLILLKTLIIGNYLIFLVPITFFGAPQLYALFKKQWGIKVMKIVTLILIITSLLIPFIYSANLITKSSPTFDDINSLIFLSSKEKGSVLSCKNYEGIITYVSGQETIKNNQGVVNEIFNSYSQITIRQDLELLNVKYIWINSEIKNRYWPHEKRFYYMLQDKTTFEKIYDANQKEIYEVII